MQVWTKHSYYSNTEILKRAIHWLGGDSVSLETLNWFDFLKVGVVREWMV